MFAVYVKTASDQFCDPTRLSRVAASGTWRGADATAAGCQRTVMLALPKHLQASQAVNWSELQHPAAQCWCPGPTNLLLCRTAYLQ